MVDTRAIIKESLIVQLEGKRKVKQTQIVYNLEIIISIGYRINSFRATQTLKEHLGKRYAINEKRVAQKEQEIKKPQRGNILIEKQNGKF